MKQPTITFISLTLLLLFASAAASASLDQTCAAVAAMRPDIGYDFCVSSLSSTGAAASDPGGLAIAASNLAIANATDIVSRVSTLMETTTSQSKPGLKDCLSVCSEVFSDAIDHLSDAVGDLRGGVYGEAVTFLSAALDAADDCEEAFDEEGEASPMVSEAGSYRRLADIALTIAASLG